ncbi:DUF2382 domain-containing protein [Kineococcus terrestris]|uniref:DUF2382 domain-containing protein n=1 Tax=Kineococcus terrestris TaxID=2044856 RepID=UPI0034DB4B7D
MPPAGGTGTRDDWDQQVEVVLSEERLVVSTRRVPRERVRIVKRVVEEVRTVQVPVRVEQLVLAHEPVAEVGDGVDGGDAGPRELELVLHEEVPVVSVRVEPVERVRVRVVEVAGEETVEAVVRRERTHVDAPETRREEQ